MSKRNGYKVVITDKDKLNEIADAIAETGIVVKAEEPIAGRETRTLVAEDAPKAGAAFADPEKNPNGYIFWKTIKKQLEPHTDAIKKVKHTYSCDTGCYTKYTTYKPENGTLTKTNEEKDNQQVR